MKISRDISTETDRIIVKFKPGANKKKIHKKHGGEPSHSLMHDGSEVVHVTGDLQETIDRYMSEDCVEYVKPDYKAKILSDDFCYALQWGIAKIQVDQAWNITRGSADVKIAILDTGTDFRHMDLVDKTVARINFSTGSGVNYDMFGHGTHVAGIAAAVTDNKIGIAGVACNCSIMDVKVLGDDGGGYYSDIINGIRWAADNGAKVINMSFGGSAGDSDLENAINYAWNKGCVLVAAAGNDGTSVPSYPAYYANCIAVAATDENDNKASFSNYGSWVDVAAPGVEIFASLPRHEHALQNSYGYPRLYGSLNGTSMATPFVAGLAALLWSTPYGTDNASIRNRIINTAEQIGDIWSTYGIKRINAYLACA